MRTVKETGGVRMGTKEVERRVTVSAKGLLRVKHAYICRGKSTYETRGVERDSGAGRKGRNPAAAEGDKTD